MTEWLLDGALGLLVLGLAFGALHGRNLYASVLLFIAFGLALALVWARLGATDLALAEAAIGAGLTGVLLFAALARQPGPAELPEMTPIRQRLAAAVVVLPLLIMLVQGLAPLADRVSTLPAEIDRVLPQTGVSHPVTAVLLNLRAWDTLLELAVLLLALLGARQLGPRRLDLAEPWRLAVPSRRAHYWRRGWCCCACPGCCRGCAGPSRRCGCWCWVVSWCLPALRSLPPGWARVG